VFATVRCYTGAAPETIDSLCAREGEIRAVLASVPGTRGGHVIRSREGVIVVALGVDESSVIESTRRFVAWCKRHVVAFGDLPDPEVWAGDVLIELSIADTTVAHPPTGGRP
jgi:hypothetical protein